MLSRQSASAGTVTGVYIGIVCGVVDVIVAGETLCAGIMHRIGLGSDIIVKIEAAR
jgi:hypothetical protein